MHKVDKQDLASKPEDQRPRAPALRRAKTGQNNPPENLDKYPDLDPSVVAAAMTAGVEKEALQEMQKLMQTGKAKQKKLQDPAQSRVQFAPEVAAQQILSESDSDEPRDGGAGGSGEALHGGSSPVAMAVTKLTELVTALAADKLKKKVSKVEAALDGISASSVTETGGLGSGKRTAAARRALRQALQENPEEISQIIERAMLEDLTNQTFTPGQPAPTLCSRAWIEHRSRIGHWKTSAHCAWTVGGALDKLIKGDVAGCRARLGLLLLMLDQTACDRGNWSLSSELSLESRPPMAVLSQHVPPAVADGEQPFSRLLDPRWAEVAMSHIRETEDFVTKRMKLGKKEGSEQAEARPKPKAKAKAGDKPGHSSGEVQQRLVV